MANLTDKGGYGRYFDYTSAREYCGQLGVTFLEDWVSPIDKEFHAAGMSQGQVDLMMRAYIWRVKYLFTPKTYTFWQRIKLALYFLKG